MTHWGWYWKVKKKHIARTLCSDLLSIDSFKLLRDGQTRSFKVSPWELTANAMPDGLKITYRKQKESTYTIGIEKLPCNYGGFRFFFKCPLCQKRMRMLYLAQTSIFLCRKCLNLSYKSQCLRPSKRYSHMNDNIKDLLRQMGGDTHQKPQHMHRSTWENLLKKQVNYETKAHEALKIELCQWYGPEIAEFICDF